MVKKAILLLSAAAGLCNAANAQMPACGTDAYHRELINLYPKVAEIQKAMDMEWRGAASKTTGPAEDYIQQKEDEYQAEISKKLYIPVVVHVIHDYGTEYVPDTAIYRMIKGLNDVYGKRNPDLAAVIAPFKPYIGDANIEFRLAQKTPSGQPTNGIVRHQSPLTNGGDDQAKNDQWAPNRYLNIWLEQRIGRGVANGVVLAYATLPAGAAGEPYYDGVMSGAAFINDDTKTIAHEVGHYLNLYHVWNSNQQPVASAVCGDDEVDDTPPTPGHFSTCPLYDTHCASGYQKLYNYAPQGGSVQQVVVDYPDTANVQNIMDYSSCTNMFTKQQVLRMRTTLKLPVAKRDELVGNAAHIASGIMDPRQDLSPIADFSVEKPNLAAERLYYMCPTSNRDFTFMNRSWRDTITQVNWTFSNGGSIIQSGTSLISSPIRVKFTEPGWVTVKLEATGNNTGVGTYEKKAVYVADPEYKLNPMTGYVQEFNEGSDKDKWPIFNHYNNDARWTITNNTGYLDNTSIMYTGYDGRIYPNTLVNSVRDDIDDFFTPAFDLSSMKGGANCNLNFMSSGAFRFDNADQLNDVLEVNYSIDCGASWVKLDSVKKNKLANKGTVQIPYAPLWTGDWTLQSITIPENARTDRTFFRFRYKPSVNTTNRFLVSNGNNFYIDRINVSPYPLGINTVVGKNNMITVAPNPTSSGSYVVIEGNENKSATVQVTDITGKLVYRVEEQLNNKYARIDIPASAISAKGIYMVQVITGDQSHTEKLVVY